MMCERLQDRDGFTAVHWAAMEDEALTMLGP